MRNHTDEITFTQWMRTSVTSPRRPDTADVERRVLGRMLRSGTALDRTVELLGAGGAAVFASGVHRGVYRAALALRSVGDMVTVTTLSEVLGGSYSYDGDRLQARQLLAGLAAAGADSVFSDADVARLIDTLWAREMLAARVAILQAGEVPGGPTAEEYPQFVRLVLQRAVGGAHPCSGSERIRDLADAALRRAHDTAPWNRSGE